MAGGLHKSSFRRKIFIFYDKKKRCLNHGFNISKSGIHKVLKGKGKYRQKSGPKHYPKKVSTPVLISKVKSKIIIENPPTQRSLVNSFNTSLGTMNKIINVDLNLKKK